MKKSSALTPSAMDSLYGFNNPSIVHPLDPLSSEELKMACETIIKELVTTKREIDSKAIRFHEVYLEEPPKDKVIHYIGQTRKEATEKGMPRVARCIVYSTLTNFTYIALVDVSRASLQDDVFSGSIDLNVNYPENIDAKKNGRNNKFGKIAKLNRYKNSFFHQY